MAKSAYKPAYTSSWALIIGIDKYENVGPLSCACSDAKAVAHDLKTLFGFPDTQITILLNEEATQNTIRKRFLGFAKEATSQDDRLLVFYAGHGYTHHGNRGEVGFLVPVDGSIEDLSSLVRWDDLTRNAELIAAKHILFVMDACYGGLALTRGVSGGSVRFLQGIMLQRFSRQVLTAGKGDEVVADEGGPVPSHSIFTGHFLEALEGKAANADGIITANTVMAYVYEHVARDPHSRQTPHFGFLDGDGDFIFQAPCLESLVIEETKGKDILFEVPAISVPQDSEPLDLAQSIKRLLADSSQRIRLHDTVVMQIRHVLAATNEEEFPVQTRDVTPEEVAERLEKYEAAMANMIVTMLCLSHWAEGQQTHLIEKCISRLTDHFEATSGRTIWLNLRWYPAMLLLYAGGLGSLAAQKYDNLATALLSRISSLMEPDREESAVLVIGKAGLELTRTDAFKLLPGHEKQYVPRSEYLYKELQPLVDDVLFLGKSYESLFDRYEVLQALVYADLHESEARRIWGPIGRFGWKYAGTEGELNPFTRIIAEAARQKEKWPPLQVGLFRGSYERFSEVATAYEGLLKGLNWW
jgi:hypothetical protein